MTPRQPACHGRLTGPARAEDRGDDNVEATPRPGTRPCTSIVVAAELRFGAVKKGSDRLSAQLEAILSAIDAQPFDVPADVVHAELGARLEVAGALIGGNDVLIAAHALATDCIIVTADDEEPSGTSK
jgi:predicted nucleic acid-binding protein